MSDQEKEINVRDYLLAINRERVYAQNLRESNPSPRIPKDLWTRQAEESAIRLKAELDTYLKIHPDEIPQSGYRFEGQSNITYSPGQKARIDQTRRERELPSYPVPSLEQGAHLQQQSQEQYYNNTNGAPLPGQGNDGRYVDQRSLDNNGRPINPAPRQEDEWGRAIIPQSSATNEWGQPIDPRSTNETGRPIDVPRTPTILDQQEAARRARLDPWEGFKQRMDPLGLNNQANGGNNGGFGQ